MRNPLKNKKGQVMLMTILVLGGTVLAISATIGLLIVFQIRQTTNFSDSTKSIFASDAGIEWGLYNYFNQSTPMPTPTFSNGANFSLTCFDDTNNQVVCANASTKRIRSVGTAGGVKRALEFTF